MGFIHQKQVFPTDTFRKKTFQVHIRVKHIIIITDNIIRPRCHIQAQFKRADHMLPGLFQNHFPCKYVGLVQQLIHRIIDPVKMSFCIWARIGIAGSFIHQAQLFLCRNLYRLCPAAIPVKNIQCFFCNRRCNRLSRQVKNPVAKSFPDCLHCRKQSRHSLARAGRSLDKQIFLPQNRPVNTGCQLFLPFAVWKRKFQPLRRFLPQQPPVILKLRPFLILAH